MITGLQSYFTAITDSENSLLSLRSRILNAILNFVFLFGIGITLLGLLTPLVPPVVLIVDSSLIPLSIILRSIYRRGHFKFAARSLITLGFIIITTVIFAMGSVHSPATSTFILLIILATVFEGKSGGLVASFLSSGLIFVLLELDERTELMPDVFTQTGTSLPSMITYAMVFLSTSFILYWLFDRLFKDQLYLKAANDELEERVQARTLELQKSRDALEVLNGELIRADRMKDEFLANMSHELRTPLTGILGLTEALRYKIYGDLNEKQIELLSNVEQSGEHLLSMINDILDLSKIEANKMDLDPSFFRAESICAASAQIVKGMAGKKKIGLTVHVEPGDLCLRADPKRLKQALVNLLSNAIKFTPDGGKIGLVVNADEENEVISFTVWDTGIGIRLEDQKRLFQPFVQLDGSLSRQNSGSGLGLSLVRKLVEIQGGSVRVESTSGEGSRFTIRLPWRIEDLAIGSGQDADGSKQELVKVDRPLRIMLVDDNTQFLETFRDGLTFIGHTVKVYFGATEALQELGSVQPQVIITDIQMPLVSGLEFAKKVRGSEIPTARTVPIIALTALAMEGDEQRCMEAGMNRYLTKPITISNLSKILSEIVPF